MSIAPDQQIPIDGSLTLSRVALKALGEFPDLVAGPLSPLARVEAPAEPADRNELIRSLESAGEVWRAAIPALIDPALTAVLMFGNTVSSLMGQYLWADGSGSEPGFRLELDGRNLSLTGPLTLDDVQVSLLDALSLSGVSNVTPMRMALSADQLWVFAALVDAYIEAAARRRLQRKTGPPPGFTANEIVAAWQAGIAGADASWSVTLFSLLNPDAVPQVFEQRIPGVMKEMDAAGLLAVLEGHAGDPLDEIYVLGPELDLLCRSLASGATNFGLVFQRRISAARVEATVMGGWRTGGGIWLADISSLPGGKAELSVYDPRLFLKLMEQVFKSDPEQAGEPVVAGGYTLESILARLKGGQPATVCQKCGAMPAPGTRFCGSCGNPLDEVSEATPTASSQSVCPKCGNDLQPGAAFCVHCGVSAK